MLLDLEVHQDPLLLLLRMLQLCSVDLCVRVHERAREGVCMCVCVCVCVSRYPIISIGNATALQRECVFASVTEREGEKETLCV